MTKHDTMMRIMGMREEAAAQVARLDGVGFVIAKARLSAFDEVLEVFKKSDDTRCLIETLLEQGNELIKNIRSDQFIAGTTAQFQTYLSGKINGVSMMQLLIAQCIQEDEHEVEDTLDGHRKDVRRT